MSGLMGIIARTVKSIGEDGVAKYELHISNSDDEFGGTRLAVKSTSIPLTKKDFDNNFVISSKKFDGEKLMSGEMKLEDAYAEAKEIKEKKQSLNKEELYYGFKRFKRIK